MPVGERRRCKRREAAPRDELRERDEARGGRAAALVRVDEHRDPDGPLGGVERANASSTRRSSRVPERPAERRGELREQAANDAAPGPRRQRGSRSPTVGKSRISSFSAPSGKTSSRAAVVAHHRRESRVREARAPVERGELAEEVAGAELAHALVVDRAPRPRPPGRRRSPGRPSHCSTIRSPRATSRRPASPAAPAALVRRRATRRAGARPGIGGRPRSAAASCVPDRGARSSVARGVCAVRRPVDSRNASTAFDVCGCRRVVEDAQPHRVAAAQPRRRDEPDRRSLERGDERGVAARPARPRRHRRSGGGSRRCRATAAQRARASALASIGAARRARPGRAQRSIAVAERVEPEVAQRDPDLERARRRASAAGRGRRSSPRRVGRSASLQVVGRDLERAPELRAVAHEQAAALVRLVEPLVRVERDRVGAARCPRARARPRSVSTANPP